MKLLQKLYAEQTACEHGGGVWSFSLRQDVKQGDPITGLLVMEQCFRNLNEEWNALRNNRTSQYYDVVIGDP